MNSWHDKKYKDASDAKFDSFFNRIVYTPSDDNPNPCPACGNRLEECMEFIGENNPHCNVCGLVLSSAYQNHDWLEHAVEAAKETQARRPT